MDQLFGAESYSSVKPYLKWLDEASHIHLNKISISELLTDNRATSDIRFESSKQK